jgi:hypothetical protein
MKFLKQKTLSKFSPSDNTLFTNHYGRAVMDLTGALRLPKGTTIQRPQLSGVRTPNGGNGFIRYNTSLGPDGINEIGLEAYIGGVWEVVKAPGSAAIQKQTLGPGDDVETTFGPLDQIPSSENNIIVLVENVMQISDTNFNLTYDYGGTIGDTRIVFTSPVPTDKYVTIFFGYAN